MDKSSAAQLFFWWMGWTWWFLSVNQSLSYTQRIYIYNHIYILHICCIYIHIHTNIVQYYAYAVYVCYSYVYNNKYSTLCNIYIYIHTWCVRIIVIMCVYIYIPIQHRQKQEPGQWFWIIQNLWSILGTTSESTLRLIWQGTMTFFFFFGQALQPPSVEGNEGDEDLGLRIWLVPLCTFWWLELWVPTFAV